MEAMPITLRSIKHHGGCLFINGFHSTVRWKGCSNKLCHRKYHGGDSLLSNLQWNKTSQEYWWLSSASTQVCGFGIHKVSKSWIPFVLLYTKTSHHSPVWGSPLRALYRSIITRDIYNLGYVYMYIRTIKEILCQLSFEIGSCSKDIT